MKERLVELLDQLNHGLVERDNALKTALLAVLAGENLLLVGPPGTAKSLIARRVAECLTPSGAGGDAGEYFEYLLTKFSTPEEIFGPLSIRELKEDRFKRNTAGYLPTVRIAFLDEIFKASSSILNALLTILNERKYHNGSISEDIPLQALIAASNELPTGQEELDALYDRFLVRSFVGYVSEDNLPRLLDKYREMPEPRRLDASELRDIRQAAEAVALPTDIVSAIQRIWAEHKQTFKEDRRENLSDRRLKKAVGLLCVSAATNGRREVDLSDLLLLKDCLWNHPDNAVKVRELVMNTLRGFSRPVPLTVQATESSDARARLASASPAHKTGAKPNAVAKGYKGSGTERDPILIETLHDLAGLERPEVGQQGYWFRQTADIDCRDLTTWLKIDFQGHYDGSGHAIDYTCSQWVPLFDRVQNKSHLSNLRLNGLGLARLVSGGSEIFACASDAKLLVDASDCNISYSQSVASMVDRAVKCTISHCQSGGVLVANRVEQSTISHCQTGHVLVDGEARACNIKDCMARVNGKWNKSTSYYNGGIAEKLLEGSVVDRCFVSGVPAPSNTSIYFSGIANVCTASTIRLCAFGSFKLANNVHQHPNKRIANVIDTAAKLENNVALDCHRGESNPQGPDGKSISAALFEQHFFEHTLDWDFKSVWQWNDEQRQPELRSVGVDAMHGMKRHAEPEDDMSDLLTEQLRANLWL